MLLNRSSFDILNLVVRGFQDTVRHLAVSLATTPRDSYSTDPFSLRIPGNCGSCQMTPAYKNRGWNSLTWNGQWDERRDLKFIRWPLAPLLFFLSLFPPSPPTMPDSFIYFLSYISMTLWKVILVPTLGNLNENGPIGSLEESLLGGVALLKQVWLCWRRCVTWEGLWDLRCSLLASVT